MWVEAFLSMICHTKYMEYADRKIRTPHFSGHALTNDPDKP